MKPAATFPRAHLAALAGTVLLAACGDGPTELVVLQIEAYAGDDQVGPAGSTLPVDLAVRVTDAAGRPVPDVRIRWTVEDGGGHVSAVLTPAITDAGGIARTTRTLGPNAGVQTTVATLWEVDGAHVRFTSIATVQGATRMLALPDDDGDAQVDTVLATLARPYRVLVLDHEDAPVSGVVVSWSPGHGHGGTVSSGTATTNADGVAQVVHTLGPNAGAQSVNASVAGLIDSPVTFTATALPGDPTGLRIAGGETELGKVNDIMDPYVVEATDAHGNAVAGVSIDWAVAAGAGYVTPPRSVTAGTGTPTARATHILGPEEGTHAVTATASELAGAPQVTFTTTAVTEVVQAGWEWGGWGYYPVDAFRPDSVVVPSGRSVGWAWTLSYSSTSEHNITFEDDPAEPVSSPTLAEGTHVRRFEEPGAYRYRCTNHSPSFTEGMVGVVIVE